MNSTRLLSVRLICAASQSTNTDYRASLKPRRYRAMPQSRSLSSDVRMQNRQEIASWP